MTSRGGRPVHSSGCHRPNYFLLKSSHFDVKLDPVSYGSRGPVETTGKDGPLRPVSGSALRSNEREANSPAGDVTISSDPPGAEIYSDGKFVGQTSLTIQLPSGTHRIEVKSRGKQDWERDLDVLKDRQLTLHPVLESSP
ncbi:MAG: PEGA domain-containing protein [Candidatus Acidiferrales bacterium]|jgi:hypothetical protein